MLYVDADNCSGHSKLLPVEAVELCRNKFARRVQFCPSSAVGTPRSAPNVTLLNQRGGDPQQPSVYTDGYVVILSGMAHAPDPQQRYHGPITGVWQPLIHDQRGSGQLTLKPGH